jgi:hypothetical protein
MKWNKLGLVFNVSGQKAWAASHAMIPTPLLLEDRIRVFYGSRGQDGKAAISFVDVDINDPTKVIYEHETSILTHGETGCFDDSGVLPGCVVWDNDRVLLYYVGFNVRNTVPYSNAIGVAESFDDGITFQRVFDGAVVDRTAQEPYFSVSPCVLKTKEGWKLWYASCTKWITVNDKKEALYHIKYADSVDGLLWQRPNKSCILPLADDESNARPTVIYDGGLYHMYYSFRGSSDFRDGCDSYRIGYATSINGQDWLRKDDQTGLYFSKSGWDSKMLAYPSVLECGGRALLFYNGNGFGASGFGVAEKSLFTSL